MHFRIFSYLCALGLLYSAHVHAQCKNVNTNLSVNSSALPSPQGLKFTISSNIAKFVTVSVTTGTTDSWNLNINGVLDEPLTKGFIGTLGYNDANNGSAQVVIASDIGSGASMKYGNPLCLMSAAVMTTTTSIREISSSSGLILFSGSLLVSSCLTGAVNAQCDNQAVTAAVTLPLGYSVQKIDDTTYTLTAPPTNSPTFAPTNSPTTKAPTNSPTTSPTKSPTTSPTKSPTKSPTTSPTKSPTKSPTTSPTKSPTKSPTTSPTKSPTKSPTTSPTKSPTKSPTTSPTKAPTSSPTKSPTKSPTESPTTASPTTSAPTNSPTTSTPTQAPVAAGQIFANEYFFGTGAFIELVIPSYLAASDLSARLWRSATNNVATPLSDITNSVTGFSSLSTWKATPTTCGSTIYLFNSSFLNSPGRSYVVFILKNGAILETPVQAVLGGTSLQVTLTNAVSPIPSNITISDQNACDDNSDPNNPNQASCRLRDITSPSLQQIPNKSNYELTPTANINAGSESPGLENPGQHLCPT